MKGKKIEVTTNNIVEVLTEKASKNLSYKIDLFVKAQIKEKPKWFPSQKLWERIACKFLQINYLNK